MKRRRARELALQGLFQYEFTGREPDLKELQEGKAGDRDVIQFAGRIVRETLSHLQEIDSVIKEAAEHWVIERMAAVDRNILRASVCELLYFPDVPPAVAINEALEIAKKYSSSESVAFINGVLDRISRTRQRP
jgi:N utilization substance protein B